MTISELIVDLQALKCEHGDLPVLWLTVQRGLEPLMLCKSLTGTRLDAIAIGSALELESKDEDE